MVFNSTPLLSIVLPFYHEEECLAQTLKNLQESVRVPHEILLIYDDPADPTLPIIHNLQIQNAAIKLFLNEIGPGIPGAIKTGINKSTGEFILFLVADDPGPVLIINEMFHLLEQGYDLVSGTRYDRGGAVSGTNKLAKIISSCGNQFAAFIFRSKSTDLTCGIKMFKKSILSSLKLTCRTDWAIAFELALQAECQNFKVAEIPFTSYNRVHGTKSYMKLILRIFNYSFILSRLLIFCKNSKKCPSIR